jgi:cob(I)alamin adenosyltransferase
MKLKKGCVQIYTGNGKGKTSAALGLALRAAGAGLKVFIGQFVKGSPTSEHKAIAKFAPAITVKQFGKKSFIRRIPDADDMKLAQEGFRVMRKIVASRKYDLVILDEIAAANKYGLVEVEQVLDLIREKPASVELVLTGRNADKRLIKAADLVTEMKEVKHYYKAGLPARVGIEK